jgi:hypothetical protein
MPTQHNFFKINLKCEAEIYCGVPPRGPSLRHGHGKHSIVNQEKFHACSTIFQTRHFSLPVTVAERSKACTVFARSEAVIVGSNLTQGMHVWCVYVFILCLCCPVFR